jgi:hypothetical protein
VLYAWENPGVPVDEVVNDVLRAFHHPAARSEHIEIQRDMFETVRRWSQETSYRHQLNQLLSSESVRHGKNHVLNGVPGGANRSLGGGCGHGDGGHGKPAGSLWSQIQITNREMREGVGSPVGSGVPPPMHGQAASYYTGSSPQPQARPGSSSAGYIGAAASYGQPTPPPSQPPPPASGYGAGYPGQGGYGGQPHPHQQQHHGHGHGQGHGHGHQHQHENQHPPPAHGGYPPQYGGVQYGGAPQPPPPYGQQPPTWGQYPRY